MKITQCPSCGAPVNIRSADSLYVICEFCRSTLLRDEEHLTNIGKMAELMDDPSLIRIGTQGRFKGQHFGVIGRIQMHYTSGLWNEWYILFDDGKGGWLSEASGEIAISFLADFKGSIPAFDSLTPEAEIKLGNAAFMVTSLQTAHCIAGEGELPFKVEGGYEVNSADLREISGKQRFATIDYSETPPLLFIGTSVAFKDLKLTELKDSAEAVTVKTQAFNCPKCASPLTLHSTQIERVICPSCRNFIGIENNNIKLLNKAITGKKIIPTFPLGSRGTIDGIGWEIIGFMQRTTKPSDKDYEWSEYLLFNQTEGFAWLTEYQGHWNFARTLSAPPNVPKSHPGFEYLYNKYTLFSSDNAIVTYVLGEFYWQVSKGETVLVEDYISPPLMLSREVSGKEVSWSRAEYIEPEMLYTAFNIKKLPSPRKVVFSNQPNPYKPTLGRILATSLILVVIATLIQFYFMFFEPATPWQTEVISLKQGSSQYALPEFTLKGRARMLRIQHRTNLNNNWADITSTLVNKDTGEHQQGTLSMAYYHGYDDGAWTEGSNLGTMSFRNVPAGNYYLIIDAETGTPPSAINTSSWQNFGVMDSLDSRITDTITIIRNPVTWSNFILALLGLAIFPLFSIFRSIAFETKRWNESDFSPNGYLQSGDDDDEDE